MPPPHLPTASICSRQYARLAPSSRISISLALAARSKAALLGGLAAFLGAGAPGGGGAAPASSPAPSGAPPEPAVDLRRDAAAAIAAR